MVVDVMMVVHKVWEASDSNQENLPFSTVGGNIIPVDENLYCYLHVECHAGLLVAFTV